MRDVALPPYLFGLALELFILNLYVVILLSQPGDDQKQLVLLLFVHSDA